MNGLSTWQEPPRNAMDAFRKELRQARDTLYKLHLNLQHDILYAFLKDRDVEYVFSDNLDNALFIDTYRIVISHCDRYVCQTCFVKYFIKVAATSCTTQVQEIRYISDLVKKAVSPACYIHYMLNHSSDFFCFFCASPMFHSMHVPDCDMVLPARTTDTNMLADSPTEVWHMSFHGARLAQHIRKFCTDVWMNGT